jgi:hypothetical protein
MLLIDHPFYFVDVCKATFANLVNKSEVPMEAILVEMPRQLFNPYLGQWLALSV